MSSFCPVYGATIRPPLLNRASRRTNPVTWLVTASRIGEVSIKDEYLFTARDPVSASRCAGSQLLHRHGLTVDRAIQGDSVNSRIARHPMASIGVNNQTVRFVSAHLTQFDKDHTAWRCVRCMAAARWIADVSALWIVSVFV